MNETAGWGKKVKKEKRVVQTGSEVGVETLGPSGFLLEFAEGAVGVLVIKANNMTPSDFV